MKSFSTSRQHGGNLAMPKSVKLWSFEFYGCEGFPESHGPLIFLDMVQEACASPVDAAIFEILPKRVNSRSPEPL